MDKVYAYLGAATGAAAALAAAGQREASAAVATGAAAAAATLSEIQATADARARKATWTLYGLAGIIAGILAGARLAALSLWWWVTEDEIKARLLQGSPVKYRTKDLEALLADAGLRLAPSVEPPPRPAGASVELGPVVRHANDHLATAASLESVGGKSADGGADAVPSTPQRRGEAVMAKK
jgi:hypothetical protein